MSVLYFETSNSNIHVQARFGTSNLKADAKLKQNNMKPSEQSKLVRTE